MVMKKAIRVRLFWLLLVILAVIPTSVVCYVSYLKGSGNLAKEIASAISRQADLIVTLNDIEFEDLRLRNVKLKGLAIQNPQNKDYPYLDADVVKVDGFKRSTGSLHIDTVTLSSYAISIGASGGAKSSSGVIWNVSII